MGQLIYVTGGARSGKSRFAERQASKLSQNELGQSKSGQENVTYLATAQAFDEEMTLRIERHRADRPASWTTLEEPLDVVTALGRSPHPVVLLDCLSLWISNLLLAGHDDAVMLERVAALLEAAQDSALIVVSNEVGSGIVPDNALARRYRDVLGWANQQVAAAADEAYLLVSGLSVRLK